MFGTESPVQKAENEIRKLNGAREDLASKKAETLANLETATAALGEAELEAILQGGDAGTEHAKVDKLRQTVDGYEKAQAVLEKKLRGGFDTLHKAKAAECRKQADDLEVERERHRFKLAELLKPVVEHEGCSYVPDFSKGHDVIIGGMLRSAGVSVAVMPRSLEFPMKIQALRSAALEWEKRPAPDAGSAEASTLYDLLGRVCDPLKLGPTRAEVTEWAESINATRRESLYRLNWRGGKIDRSISKVVASA